jgi:hypothetical protein
MILGKWKKREKYIRTEFVATAFDSDYPREVLGISVAIDAMINILDDLLDEDVAKKAKTLYILEYLRIFSLYSKTKPNPFIQECMFNYFNKLIMLAVFEGNVLKKVKEEKQTSKIIRYASKLLMIRAYDIDIFVEVVLDSLDIKKDREDILDIARAFRAINILKKDVIDIPYDLSHRQETLMTYLSQRKGFEYSDFMKKLLDNFINGMKDKSKKCTIKSCRRFLEMSSKDRDSILSQISK